MDLTIASLLDVVERLGWTGGKTDLLTYPEYVIYKGVDTIIDEKRIRLGLKLNVYTPPFNLKEPITPKGHNLQDIIKNNQSNQSSIIDQEYDDEDKQEIKQSASNTNNTNISE